MSLNLPIQDQSTIESLIPQKFPFVMVGELITYSETQLKSAFIIKEDNIFVSNGKFQASGIVEHQAQSVALHTGYKYALLGKPAPVGYIGAIKYFENEKLPNVEDQLISDVTILNELMDVTLVEIVTKLNGKIIAKSEMKTIVK